MGVVRLRECPYAPYVYMPPIHLDTPVCSEIFKRVFILLIHKMFSYFRGSHGGLSELRVYSYAPVCFKAPMCGHPPYVWTSPYVQMPPNVWGHPNKRGHPNIWGYPNIWGCPNIWGNQTYGGAQTYGDI